MNYGNMTVVECYWFIIHFPIKLDFLFITFRLHVFLSWMFSLSISSSAISASTFSNHVFLGLQTGLLPSTLISINLLHPVFIIISHHMFIPYQSTTSNDSCDRVNSHQTDTACSWLVCHSRGDCAN